MKENRLQKIREAAGKISQSKLAEMIGIPAHKLRDAESGKTKISTEIAAAIEEKLGYNLRWVLTGEGPEKQEGREAASYTKVTALEPLSSVVEEPTAVAYCVPRLRHDLPTLDELMHLLRIVISVYRSKKPRSKVADREIPLIFRHFVDNYERHLDEVEVAQFIDEWFNEPDCEKKDEGWEW